MTLILARAGSEPWADEDRDVDHEQDNDDVAQHCAARKSRRDLDQAPEREGAHEDRAGEQLSGGFVVGEHVSGPRGGEAVRGGPSRSDLTRSTSDRQRL